MYTSAPTQNHSYTCQFYNHDRSISMIINSTLVFCLIPELEEALLGLKIVEILISSDKSELWFCLRSRDKETNLYFSTNPQNFRIEIRRKDEPNPHKQAFEKTNLFSFALGGYIQKIEQLDFDRVIKIFCEKKTQFGSGDSFAFIFELTGRNSNVILMKKDETIVDCLRKIDINQNRFRQVLPGINYLPPPPPKKRNPFSIREEEFSHLIRATNQTISEWLIYHFNGLDKLLAQKIVIESGLDFKENVSSLTHDSILSLWKTFSQTFEKMLQHQLSFHVIKDPDGDPKTISCVDLPFILKDQKIPSPSLSSAIKSFYSSRLEKEKERKEAQNLSLMVRLTLAKLKKRERKIEEDEKQAERLEEYKRFGELLMLSQEKVKKGQTSVELTDIFDPQLPQVEIPLDVKLGAIGNSQAYFKKYKKAKDGLGMIHKRRAETQNLITYLVEILRKLSLSGAEINWTEQRQNLIKLGILRLPRTQIKTTLEKKFSPRRFVTKSGCEIFVGRNNQENDYLTFKFAKPDDLWFHTQDVPGSHVLLRRKDKKTEPSSLEIKETAQVAAYYSKVRKEKKASVIYTQAKHVRKPKRGKPGLALVQREKSILVEPRLLIANRVGI